MDTLKLRNGPATPKRVVVVGFGMVRKVDYRFSTKHVHTEFSRD